jgi:hypothetical protein
MRARDRYGNVLELTRIVGDCDEGYCESVSRTDRGTAVVRGVVLHSALVSQGEVLAEVSINMLLAAARALNGRDSGDCRREQLAMGEQ